jgi:hypothetical protein
MQEQFIISDQDFYGDLNPNDHDVKISYFIVVITRFALLFLTLPNINMSMLTVIWSIITLGVISNLTIYHDTSLLLLSCVGSVIIETTIITFNYENSYKAFYYSIAPINSILTTILIYRGKMMGKYKCYFHPFALMVFCFSASAILRSTLEDQAFQLVLMKFHLIMSHSYVNSLSFWDCLRNKFSLMLLISTALDLFSHFIGCFESQCSQAYLLTGLIGRIGQVISQLMMF